MGRGYRGPGTRAYTEELRVAAKRETSLLDERSRTESTSLTIDDTPTLDLGIPGVSSFELLAVGPAANVYRARQPALDRSVEVKVLQLDPEGAEGRAFERERVTAGRLTGHSGIVPLLDAGLTNGGHPYLVFPHYRRGSMARLVGEHGPLGWREAAFLVETVSVTLCEIHGRGLVHGALSPDAVLLTDFLLPRVTDLSRCGPVGADGSGPVPADDVAALGRLLRFLVSGSVDGAATGIPAPVRDVMNLAAHPVPGRRPADAAAFVVELRRAVARIEGRATDSPALIGPAPVEGAASDNGASSDGGAADPGVTLEGEGPITVDEFLDPLLAEDPDPVADADTTPAPEADPGSATVADDPGPASRGGATTSVEARYILALVACIAVAVLVMVLAAVLAVS